MEMRFLTIWGIFKATCWFGWLAELLPCRGIRELGLGIRELGLASEVGLPGNLEGSSGIRAWAAAFEVFLQLHLAGSTGGWCWGRSSLNLAAVSSCCSESSRLRTSVSFCLSMFMVYVLSMPCSFRDLCRPPQHRTRGAEWGLNTENWPLPGRFKHAAQSDRSHRLRSQLPGSRSIPQKLMLRWRLVCKMPFEISSCERQEGHRMGQKEKSACDAGPAEAGLTQKRAMHFWVVLH